MDDFTHIILTRFNVQLSWLGERAPDETWIEHRFALFDQFCYPSLRSQTNQNFTWLVFFDAGTPERFRERINRYAQWDNFVPCFVKDLEEGKRNAITAHMKPGSTHLITTRLDNDDALARQFVETVQRHFQPSDFHFLNFTNGFMLNLERHTLYHMKHRANPFISLVEKVEGFKSVWCGVSHNDCGRLGSVEQLALDPAWVMLVHGKNVCNKVGYEPRVSLKRLAGSFNLNYIPEEVIEREYLFPFRNRLVALERLWIRAYRLGNWYVQHLAKKLLRTAWTFLIEDSSPKHSLG